MTRRILIIDDEESIQTVVQFGIKLVAGWDVFTASSGSQGINLAQTERFDAILLDLVMPTMDGVATLKALQAHEGTKQIPVIFLTAKAQTSEQDLFSDLGISGIIPKPFNSLDLPQQITTLLHWKSV